MSDNVMILNSETVWGILTRFAVNLFFLIILIRVIYFRYSKKGKFLFTFFVIGIIVFLVSSIMKQFDIGVGMAFGLFAIFGILRLKTRNFGVKDMAYLFTAIGLSVINALGIVILPLVGILAINIVVIISIIILEEFLRKHLFKKHTIIYDNLNMLSPDKLAKLLKEISARTGRDILRVKIRKIDFKKEIAELDIFFRE